MYAARASIEPRATTTDRAERQAHVAKQLSARTTQAAKRADQVRRQLLAKEEDEARSDDVIQADIQHMMTRGVHQLPRSQRPAAIREHRTFSSGRVNKALYADAFVDGNLEDAGRDDQACAVHQPTKDALLVGDKVKLCASGCGLIQARTTRVMKTQYRPDGGAVTRKGPVIKNPAVSPRRVSTTLARGTLMADPESGNVCLCGHGRTHHYHQYPSGLYTSSQVELR
jgi:hypothetical protein